MINNRFAIIAVVMTLLAAGCASAVVMQTSHDFDIRDGVLGDFRAAAGGRDIKTVIIGNPFRMEKAAFEHVVLAEMQGKNIGQPTHFTTTPNDTADPSYRIIVDFESSGTSDKGILCRSQSRPSTTAGPPSTGRIGVAMAFCNGSDTLSWVVASIGGADAPSDPAFKNLITQSTFNLIPPTNDAPGDGPLQ